MCLRQEMTCIEKYHNILFIKMQQEPAEPGVYTAAVVQWLRPLSGRSWLRSPTASYQRRYKNSTRSFLAERSA